MEQDKSWYKIQSGNVTGYVKSKFFATGAEAEAIADEVAYNVAVVHPEELNVRTQPSEEAEVVTVAHSGEEIEVVAFDGDPTEDIKVMTNCTFVMKGGEVYKA